MTDDRNYVAEAVAIANGESALLAQQEHLVALVAQIAGRDSNLRCVVKLLTAIMVDNDLPRMCFPPELLQQAESGLTKLAIKAEPDGGVTVTRHVVASVGGGVVN